MSHRKGFSTLSGEESKSQKVRAAFWWLTGITSKIVIDVAALEKAAAHFETSAVISFDPSLGRPSNRHQNNNFIASWICRGFSADVYRPNVDVKAVLPGTSAKLV